MGQGERRGREGWSEIIRGQEESGLSARAFCVRESINPTSFYKWRGRIRQEGLGRVAKSKGRRAEFIEVGEIGVQDFVLAKGSKHSMEVRLDFGDGFTVTVRRG